MNEEKIIEKDENGNIEKDKLQQAKEVESNNSIKENEISPKLESEQKSQQPTNKKPQKKNKTKNEKNQNEMVKNKIIYKTNILSDKNHYMAIKIEEKERNLILYSSYVENYISFIFRNKFSLEELKSQSDYYKQFNDVDQIINELIEFEGNVNKADNQIIEKENEIILIIQILSKTFKSLEFILKKENKSDKQKLIEYEYAIQRFKNKFIIQGLESKILNIMQQKEAIKMLISPFENMNAKLLYCYYDDYSMKNLKKKYNPYKPLNDVKTFHTKCDNKNSILVICKSNNEIFGGYTPLCFLSDDSFGHDYDSFVFDLNRFKKFSKMKKQYSIRRYENYGPCFSYDLFFKENTMNFVRFKKEVYGVDEEYEQIQKRANSYDDWTILESLEIFQIERENYHNKAFS